MLFTAIPLDATAATPLHRQFYDGLRDAILTGRLLAGARLPSTRVLASELSLSRNTVLNAYAQLLAEGYIEAQHGSGTYVARTLPDTLLAAGSGPISTGNSTKGVGSGSRQLSRRGTLLATTAVTVPSHIELRPQLQGPSISFRPGQPAIDAFPYELWGRIAARRWQRPPPELLGYGDPAGYWPLRAAIAAYLQGARAVRCQPDQVIVVSGSQQALDLAARVLLDPGDRVWIEDPSYGGARGALLAAGTQLCPLPVDHEGLDVAAGVERCADARLAYVTPSHQYPVGVTMSLSRRLALLSWASRSGAWVLEDDYDSEYRYAGRPLASLQGLDSEGRVLYIGTFSKVLFPALRLGYMVVPPDLVDPLVSARALSDRHGPSVEQALVADFITEGHFVRHIRRMRALYAERQAALVTAARRELPGLLEVAPAEAGMHLVGWLPPGINDQAVARNAAAYGLDVSALSLYSNRPPERGGLLLGYTALSEQRIQEGVRRLRRVLEQ